MKSKVNISFVIPAYNEEKYIKETIESIHKYVPSVYKYEVIVCDNGSKDDTVDLSIKLGATVIEDKNATIAKLRNLGVELSNGDTLVFLDADIHLTSKWRREFGVAYNLLQKNPYVLTGSRYDIDTEPSWVELAWFKPMILNQKNKPKYINSGHLITSKKLFESIGGFDERLETGEDYDFGVRATKSGGCIVNNQCLQVIHKGYPKTIYHFFKREMWHGRSDWKSISSVLSSRVLMVSILVVLGSVASVFFLFYGDLRISMYIGLSLLFLIFILVALRLRLKSLSVFLRASVLQYVYLWARFLSLLKALSIRKVQR